METQAVAVAEVRVPLTVTQLATQIKDVLKNKFGSGTILLKGEVMGLKNYSSGLWFEISDGTSKLEAKVWSRDIERLSPKPSDGQTYIFHGRLDFYPKNGRMSFIVYKVEYDSIGQAKAEIEKLRERLRVAGYLAAERKRKIPFLPKAVALVTSSAGAVLEDLKQTIWSRFPNMELLLYPVLVQGKTSPDSVRMALAQANAEGRADVVIVARGGGSFEDLLGFNSEMVIRAILKSKIPVITALGHTSDITLADEVADLSCRTPTAAGAAVVPEKKVLLAKAADLQARMLRRLQTAIALRLEAVKQASRRLLQVGPLAQVRRRGEELKLALARLERAHPRNRVKAQEALLVAAGTRLARANGRYWQRKQTELAGRRADVRMARALQIILATKGKAMTTLALRFNDLSPQTVLERGYAIVSDESGKTVRGAAQTRMGAALGVRFATSTIKTRVEEV
jgi:exodeoxyribonuclease VII large subunit